MKFLIQQKKKKVSSVFLFSPHEWLILDDMDEMHSSAYIKHMYKSLKYKWSISFFYIKMRGEFFILFWGYLHSWLIVGPFKIFYGSYKKNLKNLNN